MNPLISVIVPCYLQAQYLDECLQSVLDQTYQNWECIIVNDGSPDHTEEVANKWLEKDPRFRYIDKENGGLSSARNAGLKEAKGEWIQFLDCDDVLKKEKFEKSILINDVNYYDLIITNFEMLSNGKALPPFCQLKDIKLNLETFISEWDLDFNIPIHCSLFKKESIGDLLFNESLKAKEDWIFWIDFFLTEKKYLFIDRNLVLYRINQNTLGTDPELISIANSFIFNQYDEKVKRIIFEKLNNNEQKLKKLLKSYKSDLHVILNKPIINLYFKFKNLFN